MKKNFVKFIAIALVLSVLCLAGCGSNANTDSGESGKSSGSKQEEKNKESGKSEVSGLKKDAVVVFYGDSITDGGRVDYSVKDMLGANHPKFFNDYMKQNFPNENIKVYNTGVSGDTTIDALLRLKEDVYDLNPDYIVVLLGANDLWNQTGDNFEKAYRTLIDNLLANTHAEIILMETYLMEADDGMQNRCVIPNINSYRELAAKYGDIECKIAAEKGLEIIHLPEIFKQQHEKYGTANYDISSDAIHPTQFAAKIMTSLILEKLGVNGFKMTYGPYDLSEVEAKYASAK